MLQGEDLEQEQDTDVPVKKRGGCGAQQPNITVDGMKMVAEFKTTKKKTEEQGEMCPTLLSPCTYVLNKHRWRQEVHWSTLVRRKL